MYDFKACASADITGTNIRWGRWFIDNAFGSELQPLSFAVEAQYYDGSNFVLNTDDTAGTCISFTPLLSANITLSTYTDNLDIGDTTLPGTLADISSGVILFSLSTPGEGNEGSVQLTVMPPDWMMYDFDGNSSAENANATATFGIFEGRVPIILKRQTY